MTNRAQAQKTTLRMPRDVTDWLRARARHNVTSMTAEIIRTIRAQIAAELRQIDAERQQRGSSGAAKH